MEDQQQDKNILIEAEGILFYVMVVAVQAMANFLPGLALLAGLMAFHVEGALWVALAAWLLYSLGALTVFLMPWRVWVVPPKDV